MSYVYHFTKKENLKQIINEGLKTFSNYNKLGSKIREQAIYAWLLPSDDKMGYLKMRDMFAWNLKLILKNV